MHANVDEDRKRLEICTWGSYQVLPQAGWEVDLGKGLRLFYTILYQCSILSSYAILFSQKQKGQHTFSFLVFFKALFILIN